MSGAAQKNFASPLELRLTPFVESLSACITLSAQMAEW